MNKRTNIINEIVDLLDEAIMCCYYAMVDENIDNTAITNYNQQKRRLNYYDCFILVVDRLLNNKNININSDELNKIDQLLDTFIKKTEQFNINQEQIRKALLLLDIKAFKNLNFPLDIITPDAIGIIISNFINNIFEAQEHIELLDCNMGVGNLAFTIANYIKPTTTLTAVENHLLLANVVAQKSNMMMQQTNVIYGDCLEALPKDIDIIVSDLACYEYENENYHSFLYDTKIKYFPYLVIEHYLKIEKKLLAIYLIENSFFNQKGNQEFYQMIKEKGHIDALISLPTSFFQTKEDAKSIMIISNKKTPKNDTGIFILPDLKQNDLFMKKIEEISKFLKERIKNYEN